MSEILEVIDFNLECDSEMRIELENKNEVLYVELKNGFAEMFGTELAKNKKYTFRTGTKIAIFTWQGCTLELKGKNVKRLNYIVNSTPMAYYLNTHACIEDMRKKAEIPGSGKKAPVVMMTGTVDVGKSTVCRILLNYAARANRTPLFVDLDIDQGSISVPGSIGAVLIEVPVNIEEDFSQCSPIIFHYGHTNMEKNVVLYKAIVSEMANVVAKKLKSDEKASKSGVFINTCGWIKDDGYQSLLHIVKSFEVGVILVMAQEKLYHELLRDIPKSQHVQIVLLPRSGGVVERSKSYRIEAKDSRVRQYFYGSPRFSFHPSSFDIRMCDLKIYKIGAPSLPDSCLPHGMVTSNTMKKLVPVQPGICLLNHLLAVSFAQSIGDVLATNIKGYICVTNVNMEAKTITVLSPQPKPLPTSIFLLSDVQFMEQ